MKNTKWFFLGLIMVITGVVAKAQDEMPEVIPVLNTAAVDKFIKTYIPLSKELEALGHEYNQDNDDEEFDLQSLMALDGVNKIFEKYGWTENVFPQMQAITVGYAYLKMEEEAAKLNEQERAFYNMMALQFKNMIHDDDLNYIKPKMAELDKVFEQANEEGNK